jgi:T5orf172 domain
MRIFATRVWGIDFERIPIATFGAEGHLNRLPKLARRGDRLAFVGTKTVRTHPALQGRLLGMAEIGFEPLRTLEIAAQGDLDNRDFDERGQYKFPHAVALTEAWRFIPQPLLVETLSGQLTMLATPGVEELEVDDVRRLLALPAEKLALPDLPSLARMRKLNEVLRPTTGPRPGDVAYSAERSAQNSASTYALRFEKRNIFKIGYAEDVGSRLNAVNQHVPVGVLKEQWSVYLRQKWRTSDEAYAMEQRVLALMATKRTGFERVQCSESELSSAWAASLVSEI